MVPICSLDLGRRFHWLVRQECGVNAAICCWHVGLWPELAPTAAMICCAPDVRSGLDPASGNVRRGEPNFAIE